MDTPFPAYQGDEPYVFVCYAHVDAERVYPDMRWLRESGVNLWYDEGISPGELFTDELAAKISDCHTFLYFVSPRSVGLPKFRIFLSNNTNRQSAFLLYWPLQTYHHL